MRTSDRSAIAALASRVRSALLGVAVVGVCAPGAGGAQTSGPDATDIAGWLERHRAIEHRADVGVTTPDAATWAGWLQGHLALEYRLPLAERAARLHEHVLRENAV